MTEPAAALAESALPSRRAPREIIAASRPFQTERRAQSWFHLVETSIVLVAALATTALVSWWPLRAAASIVAGLVIVRGFILYHDYMHGALVRGSRVAGWAMQAFGVLVLVPPRVWKQTHNYHHAHTAKIVGSHVGSYAMVTVDMWRAMKPAHRFLYRAQRHPLNIAFALLTVFLLGMCVRPAVRDPRKHWDSILAVVLSVAISVALVVLAGWQTWLWIYVVPLYVATLAGAYLFYVQHNYPEVVVQPRETWEHTRAALDSSSYFESGPVMAWFTGNIGYHHVHHLNPLIPFYRLPEAMAAIPELQSPGKTSLSPRDVIRALRCKLWDPARGRMVGYGDASQRPVPSAASSTS